MKITLQATLVIGALFALACISVAVKGFMSLDELADATQRADARGFAWFYVFLATIAAAFAAAAAWLLRRERRP